MNEFVWKNQETISEVGSMNEEIRKVLVIYTGGTIGMKFTADCGEWFVRILLWRGTRIIHGVRA